VHVGQRLRLNRLKIRVYRGRRLDLNQVVSRRFVKKQMPWSLTHMLLQTRTKVLNKELEDVFRRWYQFREQSAAACPPTLRRTPGRRCSPICGSLDVFGEVAQEAKL